jgi:hypothetical protein
MSGETEPKGVAIGAIFARAFAALGSHWPVLIVGALILVALPTVLLSLSLVSSIGGGLFSAGYLASLVVVGAIDGVRALYVSWVALVVLEHAGGISRSNLYGGSLMDVAQQAGPIFFCGVIAYVAVTIGVILLVIPGVIASLALSVIVQTSAVEKLGPQRALDRSLALTKGRRFAILGLLLLIYIPYIVVYFLAAEIITGWAPITQVARVPIVVHVVAPIASALLACVSASVSAFLYFDLSGWKDSDAAAEVFD